MTTQSTERRTVRIPTAELINGWRRIVEVDVDWICPECGGPRGDAFPTIAYDGRYQMHVDGWKNPCGHIDQYSDVRLEAVRPTPLDGVHVRSAATARNPA